MCRDDTNTYKISCSQIQCYIIWVDERKNKETIWSAIVYWNESRGQEIIKWSEKSDDGMKWVK